MKASSTLKKEKNKNLKGGVENVQEAIAKIDWDSMQKVIDLEAVMVMVK